MSTLRASLFVLSILIPSLVLAQPQDRYIKPNCALTPSISISNYPGASNVMTSNQLALPPGKSVPAPGQLVYVFGRVFDRDCVPVSEAKVELWQADPQGRHRFATKAALATPDPVFSGSGRVTTDNLGQFHFFTLYPGPYSYTIRRGEQRIRIRRAPHFNIRVHHPDFSSFDTNLFFTGDTHNPTDHKYKRLSDANKARVLMQTTPRAGGPYAGLQATIDITLPRKSKFRKF